MYRSCIFCATRLGENDVLESFPVGRAVAFDAWKGRLWAICRGCGRWNLAPLEERWEAVEAAEKLFVDARTRVHSENVGLARMPDGTRLVRVGEALPGEFAAWRYGAVLARRRTGYLVATGVVGVLAVSWAGLAVAGVLGGAGGLISWANIAWQRRQAKRVMYRLPAERSPSGETIAVRRNQLSGMRLTLSEQRELAVHLPVGRPPEKVEEPGGAVTWRPVGPLTLAGPDARSLLGRALVESNRKGATRRRILSAVELISRAGDAEEFLRSAAAEGRELPLARTANEGPSMGWRQFAGTFGGEKIPANPSGPIGSAPRLAQEQALALEMSLHEESERRALAGELAELEAAWREAEEIAAIADTLPLDPLKRMGLR